VTSTDESDPLRERFDFLVNAPALFNAVATAAELRIFHFLAENPLASHRRIQEFSGLPAHQLRVLLQSICATGLLVKRDGRYTNSAVAAELLASDAPDSWSHILPGWKEVYYPAFAHMTQAIRSGTNTALDDYPGDAPTLYQRLAALPEVEETFHRAMSAFSLRTLGGLLKCDEFTTLRHLLDVGGGDGMTSAALAERHPDLRLTVFDMPSVSRLAEDRTRAEGQGRVSRHPGDLFEDDFPTGVDGVLFSHVLEIFDGEQIRALVKKAYDVLPSGGRILVYGFNASDDETTGIYSARLGLYFNVLASGQGMAYPARDYEEWLRRAGFADVRTVTGLPYEHGLTLGTKP
jgi:hypothetical protein